MRDKNTLSSKKNAKKAAVCATLAVCAAVTGILEGMLPLEIVLPLPGVRLGLANIFVMGAFLVYGAGYALAVLLVRTFLVFLCTGNQTSLWLSLLGGLFSFGGLCVMRPLYRRFCTMVGISAACAALHGIGQWLGASLLMQTLLRWYLPPLCALCALTGALTGFVTEALLSRLEAAPFFETDRKTDREDDR